LSKLTRLIVLVTFVILAASLVSRFTTSNSHADFLGNLSASVGPGFEIQLKTADGVVVSQVAAGTYGIHVNDNASNHNFHLEGTGVNMATGIVDIQVADWTVDLSDGYYTYHCDMHPSLSATFAVGTAQPLPAPAPAPAPVVTPIPVPAVISSTPSSSSSSSSIAVPSVVKTSLAGTLKVTLSAKDKLTVTKGGKPVTTLDEGTYKLVVSDNSAKRDVTLRKISGAKTVLTAKSYTGTKSLNVDLYGGTWKIYSAANEGGIFSFFKVTN
jgi:plastocyanin